MTPFADAEWITGQGEFALVSRCGDYLTVTLHPTLADAEAEKDALDYLGCGGCCTRRHEVAPTPADTPTPKLPPAL